MTSSKMKQIGCYAAFCGAALVLSGCASPAQKTAERNFNSAEQARTHVPLGQASYTPASLPRLTAASGLKDYLVYAALNNPRLKAAFNRWKAALEEVTPAHTLPDPRFNYSYFIQQVETRVGPQEQSLGVSQAFPWFGKLELRGKAALEDANAAQEQYEAARLKLFDEVKQAYYELYYLGRAISVTEANTNLVQQFEQIAEAKYKVGSASNGDVIKAQVELDKLRDQLSTLKDLRNPTDARLNAALNRPPDAPLAFPAAISRAVLPPGAGRLVAQLKQHNPQLKGLDFQAAADQARIALARKEYFPDVTLGLNYIQTGPARTPGVADSGKDPVIANFSINLPLWWGKYRADVQSARSRYAATRDARQDLANQLSTNLKLALFKYQDAERKIALYRDALIPKARENLDVLQRSYQVGNSDFLSLIDAERILLEFQLTYERAVANREEGIATVEQLVGSEPARFVSGKETKP